MSGRPPIPSSITDPEQQTFFAELWKRRVAAVSNLPDNPTNAEIATAFNALLSAMQTSGAMGRS